MNNEIHVWDEFIRDDEYFKVMRLKYSDEFYKCYDTGLEHYLSGNWIEAESYFREAEVRRFLILII
jgi:outer membrane protein assembly factor BamD (BamD/ComL family)